MSQFFQGAAGGGPIGNVTGPSSSDDNAITRYDGTTGKLIQNSSATLDDDGNITQNAAVFDAITAPTHEAGKLFYDTDTDALTFYNSEADIALQIGEESRIKVRNESGVIITNGNVVYLNGSATGLPLIEKAQANSEDTSKVLGVVTHNIDNNSDGYITTFGLVRGLNTSGFSGGEEIFLSPTVAGGVTLTKPDSKINIIVRIGTVGVADPTDGTFQVTVQPSSCICETHGYTFNPNGFDDPDNQVTLSFVNGTRTLTIAPQATLFTYWSEGVVQTKYAPEDIVIPDTDGLHFIYYDGDTLNQTTTFSDDLIIKYAFVATIYWDDTNSKQLYIGHEYKHTTNMSGLTHEYLHETRGFALQAGGGLTDITVDQSGDLASDAQFGNEATIVWDEDAMFSFTSRASTSNIALYYKTGVDASNIWRSDETASFGVITTGTGRAAWNELTGGNWVQTEVGNNNFVLAHVFTYNDPDRKYAVIQGENEYATIPAARDGAYIEISNIVLDGLPTAEFKFLGTIIYQTSDGYANAVQSRIRSTDTGDDYIDLRGETITRGGVAGTLTDHGVLTGLEDDDHPQYVLADGTRDMETLTINPGGGVTFDMTSSGERTMPLQPAFSAYLSVDALNQTGDNTSYTLVADTEIYDQGSDYNNATGVFTAPVTGRYTFAVSWYLQGIDTANQDNFFSILTTSNRTYRLMTSDVDKWSGGGASFSFTASAMMDMDAGDTASVAISVSGTSKTVDIDGDSNGRTYMSGGLLV